MKTQAKPRKSRAKTRVSVSFPSAHYAQLTGIAGRKRVSVAWVVREAVEQYLTAATPLFPPHA